MLVDALPRAMARPSPLALERVAVALFVLLSIVYFAQAATLAAHAPFWMDEILTLWTARLPDAAGVWSALKHGAEFTPPLYDWLIHVLQQAGITGSLGLRLPSIIAIYVTALATGVIARRHAGTAPAALAAGVILSSGLFGYAVQVRPYALVTALFACALALHDHRQPPSTRRLAAIATLLAVAIGMHFYALLLAIGLAILELVRARHERRPPCRRTLMAITLAGCSILLWFPILLAARTYSGGDVGAPDYYAHPTPFALVQTYVMVLGWMTLPLAVLFGATLLVARKAGPLRLTALVVGAIPIGVFVFALLVSHSYADRYALAGGIGIALLFASLVQQLGPRTPLASAILLALLVLLAPWRDGGELAKADRLDALAVIQTVPPGLPIATGSGLRFFELRENTNVGARLIFLNTPDTPSSDPTNRHQVLRWKAIDPDLRVANARSFLCATRQFYLFAQPGNGGADALPAWLSGRTTFTSPAAGSASLTLVHSRGCSPDMRKSS